MYSNVTDEQLYKRYQDGEVEALDELLIRHGEGLVYFLFGLVKNYEDAEDLMMETFALLIAKKVHFYFRSSFKTWLYGIGRNLARNYLRKNSNICSGSDVLEMLSLENEDVESSFLKKEEEKQVYGALLELNEEYRMVMYLLYFEKMDAHQIARVLNKTVKQVYNLTARAKEQLRGLLNDTISL